RLISNRLCHPCSWCGDRIPFCGSGLLYFICHFRSWQFLYLLMGRSILQSLLLGFCIRGRNFFGQRYGTGPHFFAFGCQCLLFGLTYLIGKVIIVASYCITVTLHPLLQLHLLFLGRRLMLLPDTPVLFDPLKQCWVLI